ncbi:hypothetical protein AWENTII_003071 [Aspergillus wentii]
MAQLTPTGYSVSQAAVAVSLTGKAECSSNSIDNHESLARSADKPGDDRHLQESAASLIE